MSEGDQCEKISFKKIKKKPPRRTFALDDEEDPKDLEQVSSKLSEMKELQELRKRPNGVNVIGLALGKKITIEEEVALKDPFKIQTGGMVNMQALKSGKVKQVDDAYDTGIGTQFSVETNKRDEDEDMMKFIEEQLKKKTGTSENPEDKHKRQNKSYTTPEEAALQAVPSFLRESTTKGSEEMLSNQMLSGIPEVDLGIEAKIKNIEATEEAKLKLLRESQNKKEGPSQFVPSNMAVNFVQHNRFTLDNKDVKKRKLAKEPESENSSEKNKKTEKATDDYHFEKK